MLKITPIPAFQDNYIWMIQNGNHVAVVDPGDAAPVISTLQKENLTLDAILITHHHNDHIGGVQNLLKEFQTQVFAPANESFDFPHQAVRENDLIQLPNLKLNLSVLDIPGHTNGHVAYYGLNHLFCGDTLFGGGCGRLFEGTYEQLFNSLQKLAALPDDAMHVHGIAMHLQKVAVHESDILHIDRVPSGLDEFTIHIANVLQLAIENLSVKGDAIYHFL